MAISFNSVPSNLRVPFVAVEFDAANAQQGPSVLAYRALLLGQKTSSAGTAADNSLHRVTSADQVATLAGRGSVLHRQAKGWFAATKAIETWIGCVPDHASGVAATGTITVTGPATATGTIHLRIGGDAVDVAVASGTAQNDIATAIAAAITAASDLPVTATAATNVVTLTARNDGTHGNEIDVRVNYQLGEALPAGVSVTIVAMASGATNPTLTTVIANMGDTWFNVIAHPWTDATSLAAIEAELSSRFGPMRMIDGWAICASAAAYGTVSALGDSRNSPHSTILRTGGMPSLPYEVAAAVAGVAALSAQNDPARPLQTLSVPGALAPAEADRDTLTERNLLLYDGVSTLAIGAGDVVRIERLITTYKTNAAGSPDTAYLDATTMLTLMYLRYAFRSWVLTKFPRHKLASDGTRFGAGQSIVTPKIMKGECMAWFRAMEELGLVEGGDQFKRDLVVERNSTDPNRLDVLLPPDIINQLIVTGVKIGFLL